MFEKTKDADREQELGREEARALIRACKDDEDELCDEIRALDWACDVSTFPVTVAYSEIDSFRAQAKRKLLVDELCVRRGFSLVYDAVAKPEFLDVAKSDDAKSDDAHLNAYLDVFMAEKETRKATQEFEIAEAAYNKKLQIWEDADREANAMEEIRKAAAAAFDIARTNEFLLRTRLESFGIVFGRRGIR